MELFKVEVVFRKEHSEKTNKDYVCYDLPLNSKFSTIKFLKPEEQEIVLNSDLLNKKEENNVDNLNDVFKQFE